MNALSFHNCHVVPALPTADAPRANNVYSQSPEPCMPDFVRNVSFTPMSCRPAWPASLQAASSSDRSFFDWTRHAVSLSVVLFFLLASGNTEVRADVIPPDRLVNWGNAGVIAPDGTKGIPNFSNCTAYPVTAGNATSLATAISKCPTQSTIPIPAGTYSGTFNVTRSVVLRGAGPTTIFTGTVRLGPYSGADGGAVTATNWTGGLTKGSTVITLASTSGLTVGQTIGLDQLNDSKLVNTTGNSGTPSNISRNGTSWYGGTSRAMLQLNKVRAINGNQVTLDTPVILTHSSALTPQAFWWSKGNLEHAGIENAKLNGGNVQFQYCTNCWAKGIEATNVMRNAIGVTWYSYRNEVRDSYIHGSNGGSTNCGPTRYGIELDWTSFTLVENNILNDICGPVVSDFPTGGNVVAYNYVAGLNSAWMFAGLEPHVAHTYGNLFEGNISHSLNDDNIWGSGSHNVFFRNRLTGWTSSATNQRVALVIEANHQYETAVGNVLGTQGKTATYQFDNSKIGNDLGIYSIGYRSSTSPSSSSYDSSTKSSLLRWGNYDTVTNAIQWNVSERPDGAAESRNLPASLYYSAKPTWWGSLPWPAFGPDPKTPTTLLNGVIPAQQCYQSQNLGGGGSFNPAKCYTYTESPSLTPPYLYPASVQ